MDYGEDEKQYQRTRPGPSCLSLPTSLVADKWLVLWKLLGHICGDSMGPGLLQPTPLTWAEQVILSIHCPCFCLNQKTQGSVAAGAQQKRVAKAQPNKGTLRCGCVGQMSHCASGPKLCCVMLVHMCFLLILTIWNFRIPPPSLLP